jgi:hypothetical protein
MTELAWLQFDTAAMPAAMLADAHALLDKQPPRWRSSALHVEDVGDGVDLRDGEIPASREWGALQPRGDEVRAPRT